MHFYCKVCKRNLSYGQPIHDCIIGFDLSLFHPDMNPRDLVNEPQWNELIQDNGASVNFSDQHPNNSEYFSYPSEDLEDLY